MGVYYGGFVIGIISEKGIADGTKIINKFLGFYHKNYPKFFVLHKTIRKSFEFLLLEVLFSFQA